MSDEKQIETPVEAGAPATEDTGKKDKKKKEKKEKAPKEKKEKAPKEKKEKAPKKKKEKKSKGGEEAPAEAAPSTDNNNEVNDISESKEDGKDKKKKEKKPKEKKVKKAKTRKSKKGGEEEQVDDGVDAAINPFAVKGNSFKLEDEETEYFNDENTDVEIGKFSKLGKWNDWFEKDEIIVDDMGNEIVVPKKKTRYVGDAPKRSNLWIIGWIGFAALLVVVATWFVKGSHPITDTDGNWSLQENSDLAKYGLFDLFQAVSDGITRNSEILLFIFAVSLFFGVALRTGAVQALMHKSLRKHKGKEHKLIGRVLLLIAILTTFVDVSWGLVAISAYIVPLFVMAGYDILTGILVMMFGSAVGLASSIYNEATIGSWIKHINKVGATLVDQTDENVTQDLLRADHAIFVRIIIFLILLLISYAIITKYAKYIRKHPTVSPMYEATVGIRESNNAILGTVENVPYTGKRRIILFTIFLMTVLFIVGTVPWGNMGVTAFKEFFVWAHQAENPLRVVFANIPEFGTWGFIEMAGILILGTILISVVHLFKENELGEALVRGLNAAMPMILIIMFASAFYSIMKSTGLHYTVFSNIMTAATDATKDLTFTSELTYAGFTAAFTSFFPIADNISDIVIDSSYSGIRSLIELKEFSKIGNLGSMVVATWGSLQPIIPTSGVTIGLLEINKIDYRQWVKFAFPYTMILFLVSISAVTISSFLL